MKINSVIFLALFLVAGIVFISAGVVYAQDKSVKLDTLVPPSQIFSDVAVSHIVFSRAINVKDFPVLKIPMTMENGLPPGEIAFKIKSGDRGNYLTFTTPVYKVYKQQDTLTIDFTSMPKVDSIKHIEAFRLENPDILNRGGLNSDNPFRSFVFNNPFFITKPLDSLKSGNR